MRSRIFQLYELQLEFLNPLDLNATTEISYPENKLLYW